jgi:hypothetical protein
MFWVFFAVVHLFFFPPFPFLVALGLELRASHLLGCALWLELRLQSKPNGSNCFQMHRNKSTSNYKGNQLKGTWEKEVYHGAQAAPGSGTSVHLQPSSGSFRFTEYYCFAVMHLPPIVQLTVLGKVTTGSFVVLGKKKTGNFVI